MKKIVVLTGAGISAESGIKTFRDADGLWEGHDVMSVASPEGWQKNQALVQDFYNQRRRQLLSVEPNAAHYSINKLGEEYNVEVITQNVDDLHERAGNKNVLHLHGELRKVRCLACYSVLDWDGDLSNKNLCSCGGNLRPHIVWFGEELPELQNAARIVSESEIAIIVGTSMQVYPAASLIGYLPRFGKIYYIDPKPALNYELTLSQDRLTIIEEAATTGLPKVVNNLLAEI